MLFLLFLSFLSFWTSSVFAAFGYTSDSTHFTVDAGSANSLVFKVNRANGDISSILYRGVQLQQPSPYSHINSGLGTATVSATTISSTLAPHIPLLMQLVLILGKARMSRLRLWLAALHSTMLSGRETALSLWQHT